MFFQNATKQLTVFSTGGAGGGGRGGGTFDSVGSDATAGW